MSDPDRLDRIEALIEKIGQRVDSTARSIEALTNTTREKRQEAQRDRARLYQSLSELATAQANFYSTQASLNSRLGELDIRQGEMSKTQSDIVEILKLLVNKQKE